MSPTHKPRFLVLRGGSTGDFLVTLPALTALRKQWPQAYIELAGYPHIAQLAKAGSLVDHVISLEKAEMARFFAVAPVLDGKQLAYIRSFDLVISYLYDHDGTVRHNLLATGVKQVIYGNPKIVAGHAIDNLMKPLEQMAIYPGPNEHSKIQLPEERLKAGSDRARAFGDKIVAIHPGSGSPKKNWPSDKFIAVAEKFRERGEFTPVFTVGEADSEIVRKLDSVKCGIPRLPLCSLVDMAEFFSACQGYIGNDSGITHLAAAVGIPVVALFGPSDPAIWAPRGPNTCVIRAAEQSTEALAAIPVEDVFKTLVEMIRGS